MNIIRINGFAEGYYSGNTYEENIYLLEDDYENIKDCVPDVFYVGELDGKHSEVEGDITIEMLTPEEQLKHNFEDSSYGNDVLYSIDYSSSEIKEMKERAKKYIDALDSMVEFKAEIKKSQVESVRRFIASINK